MPTFKVRVSGELTLRGTVSILVDAETASTAEDLVKDGGFSEEIIEALLDHCPEDPEVEVVSVVEVDV